MGTVIAALLSSILVLLLITLLILCAYKKWKRRASRYLLNPILQIQSKTAVYITNDEINTPILLEDRHLYEDIIPLALERGEIAHSVRKDTAENDENLKSDYLQILA